MFLCSPLPYFFIQFFSLNTDNSFSSTFFESCNKQSLDLVDFMLEHINPKHEEELKNREIIRDHLVVNGARKFVGSSEF